MRGDEQRKIRDFFRDHVDHSYKNTQNTIRLSRANSYEHNLRVCQICIALLENDIPFYTEVRLTCGLRPDVVCPTHVVKCIEVMHTESDKDFLKKKMPKIPESLVGDFIFFQTHTPFKASDVL